MPATLPRISLCIQACRQEGQKGAVDCYPVHCCEVCQAKPSWEITALHCASCASMQLVSYSAAMVPQGSKVKGHHQRHNCVHVNIQPGLARPPARHHSPPAPPTLQLLTW